MLTPGCFDKGGISRYSRYQINALRELFGCERVRTLSLLGPGGDAFETHFEVSWHGRAPVATKATRAAFVLQAAREALLWRPDVIHSAHVNLTPLITGLAKLCGARTVLNVYGLELWSGLSPTRRDHMSRIDQVIADCHATADHVVAGVLHPRRPTVIWDCADLDRFHPAPPPPHVFERYGLPKPRSNRVALTLGRLAAAAQHKGYDRLLEIWSAVRAQIPEAQLVIAGDGDDAGRLRGKAASLGLSDCVTFTGPIDEADLNAIYCTAHVFALVSDKGPGRGEGIPLTPIEALASGVPALVGDEDGSHEVIDRARNGLVVSPRDPAAIRDALVTLLSESAAKHAKRATEARRVAEERFGYDSFKDKHRRFYASLGLER